MPFDTEAELAAAVVAWLKAGGWRVYQEVKMFEAVADIVAVFERAPAAEPMTWVIETKLALSMGVMGQAWRWSGVAQRVSVAIPHGPRRTRDFSETVLERYGIGLLCVSPTYEWEPWSVSVVERVPARFTRVKAALVTKHLNDRQETYAAAGNAQGRAWTPFKETCDRVSAYVRQHPGCDVKELLKNVETHYRTTATARSCIVTWASAGKIAGVKVVRDGRRLTLQLADKEKKA